VDFIPFSDPIPVYPKSRDFDYNSLMMFDSTTGTGGGAKRPLWDNRFGDKRSIDSNRPGASRLDIERVAALYPVAPQPSASQEASLAAPTPPAPPAPSGLLGPLENQITKRWYSVPEAQNAALEVPKPWPPGIDGLRTITYCFENQASLNALGPVLFPWGCSTWSGQLLEDSSLKFNWDFACRDMRCLCSTPGVSEVSLRVSLARQGETAFDATLGYTDPIVPNPNPGKPRHYIRWPAESQFFGDAGGLMMGHLLGERSAHA
jgi:hypothetical protein